MEPVINYAQGVLPGLTLGQALIFLGIVVATLLFRGMAARWAVRAVETAVVKSGGSWDSAMAGGVRAPISVITLVYGFILAAQALPLPEKPMNVSKFVDTVDRLAILILGLWLLSRLISVLDSVLRHRAADPAYWLDLSVAPFISIFLRILVFATGAMVIAQNMGYSMSALAASLGLGAAAVALASKDMLANFFGSLMIMMDKPFKVGDAIKGSDFEGVVEEIGLRSTRIRTPEKTILNVPNSVIANMIVENMDRRKDKDIDARRVFMKLQLAMDASAEDLETAIGEIKALLMDEPAVEKKFEPMVYFTDFGESSYDLTVIYFASSDGAEWLMAKQKVNLGIIRKLEDIGLALAYPTRTIITKR